MKKSIKKQNYMNIYYYIVVLLAFNFVIFAVPILSVMGSQISDPLFSFFSLFCHQMFERSLCMSSNFSIGNCELGSEFIHQFPVCSRDVSFYLFMLLGGFVYVLMGKKNEIKIPSVLILILFVLPLAIDGTTQLLGFRESNNILRIITGGLAGIIVPFFLIPIMNKLEYLKNTGKR